LDLTSEVESAGLVSFAKTMPLTVEDVVGILSSLHPSIRRPEDAAIFVIRASVESAGWRSAAVYSCAGPAASVLPTAAAVPLTTTTTTTTTTAKTDTNETKRRESAILLSSANGSWPTYNLARAGADGRSVIAVRAFAFEWPDMIVFARMYDVGKNGQIAEKPSRDVAFKLPAALTAFAVPATADGWSAHPLLAGLWPPIAAALDLLPVAAVRTTTATATKKSAVVPLPAIVGPSAPYTGGTAVNSKPPLGRPISAPPVFAASIRRRSVAANNNSRRASVPTNSTAVPVQVPPPIDVAVFSGVFDEYKTTATADGNTERELERVFVEPLAAVATPPSDMAVSYRSSAAVVAEITTTKPPIGRISTMPSISTDTTTTTTKTVSPPSASSAPPVLFGRAASLPSSVRPPTDKAFFADLDPLKHMAQQAADDEWNRWPSVSPDDPPKPTTPTIRISADSKDAVVVEPAVDTNRTTDPFANNPFDDTGYSASSPPPSSSVFAGRSSLQPPIVRLTSL
jgi:hypothetical protein